MMRLHFSNKATDFRNGTERGLLGLGSLRSDWQESNNQTEG